MNELLSMSNGISLLVLAELSVEFTGTASVDWAKVFELKKQSSYFKSRRFIYPDEKYLNQSMTLYTRGSNILTEYTHTIYIVKVHIKSLLTHQSSF